MMLGIPRILKFTRAARETAQNGGCDSTPAKCGHPAV
jgi:hypothetical protein